MMSSSQYMRQGVGAPHTSPTPTSSMLTSTSPPVPVTPRKQVYVVSEILFPGVQQCPQRKPFWEIPPFPVCSIQEDADPIGLLQSPCSFGFQLPQWRLLHGNWYIHLCNEVWNFSVPSREAPDIHEVDEYNHLETSFLCLLLVSSLSDKHVFWCLMRFSGQLSRLIGL